MILGKKYKGLSVDLWACGVILFAMLYGYLPFDDSDNDKLFKKILDCEIDYPEEKENEVGKDAIDLINKILNPEPDKRIGIDEVEMHPFLEFGKKEYEKLFKPENFNKEEMIISYMENELGFDNSNNIIENDIYNNRHNHITTTYYLLKQKCLDGRLVFSFRERLYKKITQRNCLLDKNNNNNNNNNSYSNVDLNKNNNNNKKSKTTSRSESKKNLLSLKDIFNQKDFSDNRNNIIIINNTNMIHHPEKINSIYNNMILKKHSIKNISQKIETSVSQEKRPTDNKEKDRNSTYIQSANTYRLNLKKNQIKVSLKKVDKKGNKFIYFKKINTEDSSRSKNYIKVPLINFSFKTNRRKNNDIFSYQKNSGENQTFRRYVNNIHSFDANNSNNFNFNSSISNQHLNGFGSFDLNNITNSNYNVDKNEEKNKNNNINKKLMSNEILDNKHKNKISYKIAKIKLDLSKKNDTKDKFSNLDLKNKIDKRKEKYTKNIEKMCKIIFNQNKKGYTNYISNNKKESYDNNINKKKENKNNEITINLNNSNNEIFHQNSSRCNSKLIKSINTFNINNLKNKIIDKSLLTKKINCYFIPSNKSKIDKIKEMTKNDINLMSNKVKKNKIIKSYNYLSPDHINNITYENLNMNSFKKTNITNKINNYKNIISLNEKMKKNKVRNVTNLYNIIKTEKDLSKNKINYIPITSRDRKTNHSRNENFEVNNTKFETNTVFLDLAPNSKNDITSNEQRMNSTNQRNSIYSKRFILNKKNKNTDKFLVANTEMTLYQITNKINAFCKENNLNCKKEGIYKFKIYNNKNVNNFFNVEIAHSTPMNIVKIIRGKNTGNNMKDIITKLFIDIINYE